VQCCQCLKYQHCQCAKVEYKNAPTTYHCERCLLPGRALVAAAREAMDNLPSDDDDDNVDDDDDDDDDDGDDDGSDSSGERFLIRSRQAKKARK